MEQKFICKTRVTGVSSCQHLIGLIIEKRIIVEDKVHSTFFGRCKECDTWLIWLFGKCWEIKRI